MLAAGVAIGVVVGRFALLPSEIQVSGTVSVPGHQTAVVAFAYDKGASIPGCSTSPVPLCFQQYVANVTSQGTYSVSLPNGHQYSIATADTAAGLKNVNGTSTCDQEIFLTLDSASSAVNFDIACSLSAPLGPALPTSSEG
jgi:hypothetical protein